MRRTNPNLGIASTRTPKLNGEAAGYGEHARLECGRQRLAAADFVRSLQGQWMPDGKVHLDHGGVPGIYDGNAICLQGGTRTASQGIRWQKARYQLILLNLPVMNC